MMSALEPVPGVKLVIMDWSALVLAVGTTPSANAGGSEIVNISGTEALPL